MAVNVERVLELARFIERHKKLFDMSYLGYRVEGRTCGTPQCIAGWACQLWGAEEKETSWQGQGDTYWWDPGEWEDAGALLGISPRQADLLFDPENHIKSVLDNSDVDADRAVRTLRNLADTKRVSWSV